jgi:hypothetical protein
MGSDYAVGWGTLSLVNAGIAQGKGRSGLNWWVLSLFLGPIATLFLVLLPVLAEQPPSIAGEEPAWKGRPLTAPDAADRNSRD